MGCGFMYLVAIMDWYSRYVLSWELSNTLGPADTGEYREFKYSESHARGGGCREIKGLEARS